VIYIPDGKVDLDSPIASRWGFLSCVWQRPSYLWINRDIRRVWLSLLLVAHPGRGALTRLIRSIEADGFKVVIPTPLGQMEYILQRWGWRWHWEETAIAGMAVEVWERPSKRPGGARP
jgi:hypothetical protein